MDGVCQVASLLPLHRGYPDDYKLWNDIALLTICISISKYTIIIYMYVQIPAIRAVIMTHIAFRTATCFVQLVGQRAEMVFGCHRRLFQA